jgi:ubiquinol-cytochrome c reductase cytochrome b subunit
MGGGVVILMFLPWLDTNPIKSIRYRSMLHKINLMFFVAVFFYLGYLGVLSVTSVLSELGLRFSEVYFVFFYVLWFHSKTRDAKFSYMSFIGWMALFSLNDFARYVEGSGELILYGWLIPAVYLAVMFLAPLYSNLNAEKTVPERVTG